MINLQKTDKSRELFFVLPYQARLSRRRNNWKCKGPIFLNFFIKFNKILAYKNQSIIFGVRRTYFWGIFDYLVFHHILRIILVTRAPHCMLFSDILSPLSLFSLLSIIFNYLHSV